MTASSVYGNKQELITELFSDEPLVSLDLARYDGGPGGGGRARTRIEHAPDGDFLVVRVPLNSPRPSASGKTMVIATTHGPVETNTKVGGKTLFVNLTAYVSR